MCRGARSYKAFANKEEVLVALHRELSQLFLSAMRVAVESAPSRHARLERCVDMYLLAAQRSGGLMLVLQAQALRPAGMLAERRRAIFAEMGAMMREGAAADGRAEPDPLLVYGVLSGMEALVRNLMETGRLSDEDIGRARAVLLRLAIGALAEPGESVPPLPRAPESG
ncbi:MAG: hypothetical protein R3B70_18135 [Polyangiaceae bacterium]